ncbi:CDP-alcohol phosphatidyltransferase family protein [candidate division WS5 bacterium]|uniref:CDP-alcohol phosphatidyltransferase family protein n=1 Tax=candidate division WS5 bacterium TaxID=2093353 RepID=A0A419DAM4_9BACT|nr:MAG: CDP-alcohol phosphatidyltransferase family protein [candidate division WS5 bacterium]
MMALNKISDHKPTLSQIRDAHDWKREYEKYLPVSRFLFRPAGFVATWVCIRSGLTSEAVSWLSGLVALGGFLCLLSASVELLPIGIGLLLLFNLFDCVDGSIARVMKTENPYGRFLDALMSWTDMGFWAVVGIMIYQHPQLAFWQNPFGKGTVVWLAAGALASFFYIYAAYVEYIFDSLLREYWNKLSGIPKSEAHENNVAATGGFFTKIIRIALHNLRVRETQYLLLIIAYLAESVDLLLGFFLLFNTLHALSLIFIYSIRGRVVYGSKKHS